ncbi:MAG: hypothetical protein QOI07_164 [Verrucomicrobiota bacterium]|jgi:hypothetical protein
MSAKKNFRRIPPQLLAKASRFKGNEVVAACVRRITLEEVARGDFAHVGLTSAPNNDLQLREAILPPPDSGKYSRINAEGEVVVRKDLPKVSQPFTFEVPNWGDWSNGSHDVTQYRDVYQRSLIPPPLKEFGVEVLVKEGATNVWAMMFRVNEPLDRTGPDFESRLLFNLNLLQENVGLADVFAADAELSDYLRSIYQTVGWELLPPGEREKTVQAIIAGMRNASREVREKVVARYDLLAGMNPQMFVRGTGGFDRYFGAKFADDLVVFENLEYGNAVYVMFENWEALSQRSRTELMQGFQNQFERLVHRQGWENQLQKIVADKLNGGAKW